MAVEGVRAGDAESRRIGRPPVRRFRLAGGNEPAGLRDKPGANGDITLPADQTSSDVVAWFQPRLSGYTPSPLVYRGRVYVVNDNGVMQVADAKTGAEIYKVRLGGAGNTFSSSPIASNGYIYAIAEEGDAVVFEASDQYKEVAKNSLGEMSFASPAVDAESLFIRTATKLYRIKAAR